MPWAPSHLRWERFDKNGVLLTKTHYEMGFPRDANMSYYGEDRSLINEVVPYVNGKLEGDYAKFSSMASPNGAGSSKTASAWASGPSTGASATAAATSTSTASRATTPK